MELIRGLIIAIAVILVVWLDGVFLGERIFGSEAPFDYNFETVVVSNLLFLIFWVTLGTRGEES